MNRIPRVRSASGRPEDAGRLDGACDAMNSRPFNPRGRWGEHARRNDSEYPAYTAGYVEGFAAVAGRRP